jgi:RNA polymerase sigma factor (sigma-70 family)
MMNYHYETAGMEQRMDGMMRDAETARLLNNLRRNNPQPGWSGRLLHKTGALLVAAGARLQQDNPLPAESTSSWQNGSAPSREPIQLAEASTVNDSPEADTEPTSPEDTLRDAIRQLPQSERQVFILHIEHGFSTEEIAKILGFGLEETLRHLTAARETLRRTLPPGALYLLERATEWTAA